MSETNSAREHTPAFDYNYDATPEQQKALQGFLDEAANLTETDIDEVLVRGMELYDRNPELVTEAARYLDEHPEGFAAISIWRDIVELRAPQSASFDEATEKVISADPENQKLLEKSKRSGTDRDRSALIRNRFRIFAHLAARPDKTGPTIDDNAA